MKAAAAERQLYGYSKMYVKPRLISFLQSFLKWKGNEFKLLGMPLSYKIEGEAGFPKDIIPADWKHYSSISIHERCPSSCHSLMLGLTDLFNCS